MINIIEQKGNELPQEVTALRKRLSVTEGMVSSKSSALTKKVFGKELTPSETVETIINHIHKDRDKAILHYNKALDGCDLPIDELIVKPEEMSKAIAQVDKKIIKAIKKSAENITRYQSHILYKAPEPLKNEDCTLGIKVTPLNRVGIYIPGGIGGETPLVSTILMTALLAKCAGVNEIIMVTPPRADGSIHPAMLAAASIAGVSAIYKIGGVQAIASLALGTESVPQVDKIVGPGNLFVTLAKQKLFGYVDIDFFAGPSEILILADDSAIPQHIAMDLFSQAEHYPGSAILVTDSKNLAEDVVSAIKELLPTLSRSSEIEEALKQNSLIIVTEDMTKAVALSNLFAPEHLEIETKDCYKTLEGIKNSSAIFLGHNTPVAIGDYYAGPSHVLPTGGTSRFFSGLTANDFIKTSSLIEYRKDGLKKAKENLNSLAKTEGLTAHAESLNIRIKE